MKKRTAAVAVARVCPPERIFELGMKDNFWADGRHRPVRAHARKSSTTWAWKLQKPAQTSPLAKTMQRYVEIWNLVFMQFDRSSTGELALLPKPSIDTGAGLERVASVLQGKLSNYETDLFTPLIREAGKLIDASYRSLSLSENVLSDPQFATQFDTPEHLALIKSLADEKLFQNPSYRIIADHSRAATFLINDGVLPANEGRGYVLRKILRRGIRHGRMLGKQEPFMFQMVYAVRDQMQVAYPELGDNASQIAKVIEAEERQFVRVLEAGDRELRIKLKQAMISAYEKRSQGSTVSSILACPWAIAQMPGRFF